MTTRGPSGWTTAAARAAERVPLGRLHPGVVAWAAGRPRSEGWGVALSGGADSVALLLLMWAHWPGRRARLTALHFNHRLRGRESSADAAFCRRLCAALGVTLVCGRWASRGRSAVEAEARGARFAFFEREMAARRVGVLWLGHQQDDIAESIFMRLSRGSGAAGLAAPRALHVFAPARAKGRPRIHVRPLLTLKKGRSRPRSAPRGPRGARIRATRRMFISGTGSGGTSFRGGCARRAGMRWPGRRFRGSCWRRTTGPSRPGWTPWIRSGTTGRCSSRAWPGGPERSSGGPFTAGSWRSPGPGTCPGRVSTIFCTRSSAENPGQAQPWEPWLCGDSGGEAAI